MAASLLRGNAYVSGAASGIGRATAFALARHGANGLALSDLNGQTLENTGQEIQKEHPNVKVVCYILDVSNEESVVHVMSRVFKDFGRLTYAINNAGIQGGIKPTVLVEANIFQKALDVNLVGLWISQREQLKHMLTQELVDEGDHSKIRGVIVNTASMAGLIAGENVTPYIASKHGVVGATKGDAATYAKDGIRINCVCPGFIKTPMMPYDDATLSTIAQMVPMKRIAAPEEVASAIIFLASPLSSYLSGVALPIDGGFTTV
ncbi:oxidoreductase UcpA [Mytilinidion resinicola]|uniref:Oxidoreductase UcpA n=1 Tax=Mytilinidion resinicola TaxID=574789 RepID=A0A6A6YE21_9PEZI|nr:oxidoreductase UcpA [Mytilinidion resinicola]KAF2806808.1 oxidoreductase UcpA [Mytilinidion resinicola]